MRPPFFYCCESNTVAIIVLTEMQESHVHRNYSAGEVSTRLYVKNLAKQVEEKVHACMHFSHDKTQFTFHYNIIIGFAVHFWQIHQLGCGEGKEHVS